MTNHEIVVARCKGVAVQDIVEHSGRHERDVYTVLRKAGLCRDQRPSRQYLVTVMIPEIIQVSARSVYEAKKIVRSRYNENVRISSVLSPGGG